MNIRNFTRTWWDPQNSGGGAHLGGPLKDNDVKEGIVRRGGRINGGTGKIMGNFLEWGEIREDRGERVRSWGKKRCYRQAADCELKIENGVISEWVTQFLALSTSSKTCFD